MQDIDDTYARFSAPSFYYICVLILVYIQVWLANQGQFLSLLQAGLIYDRKNLDRSIFSTLATTHSTWRPRNFGKGPPYQWTETHVTLLKLSSQLTRVELNAFRERVPIAKNLSDREFMNWRVDFTYLNNFMEVVSAFTCDGDTNFNLQYATGSQFTCFSSTEVQILTPGASTSTANARQLQTSCRRATANIWSWMLHQRTQTLTR